MSTRRDGTDGHNRGRVLEAWLLYYVALPGCRQRDRSVCWAKSQRVGGRIGQRQMRAAGINFDHDRTARSLYNHVPPREA